MDKKKIDDGGHAFPFGPMDIYRWDDIKNVQVKAGFHPGSGGMSLRDWFAGKALQGLLTNTAFTYTDPKILAWRAVDFADAMLEARKKNAD